METIEMKDNPNLHDRDLIQISATIIAGALILLTLSSIVNPSENDVFNFMILFTGYTVILVFSFSCLLIMRGYRKHATTLMGVGFLYLLVIAVASMIFVARNFLQ